jgi:hypothetical protein
VHHDLTAREGLFQGIGVSNVAASVLQLAPAVLGGVERTPRDPDDPGDAPTAFQQRHEAEPEGSCRTGYRNTEGSLWH